MRCNLGCTLCLILLLGACSDNGTGPDDVSIAELAGTWNLEVWEYSIASDTSQKVDWVISQELTGNLVITEDGNFDVAPALPGGFGSDYGLLTVDADSIYWDGENDEEWLRFMLADNLTLYWPEEEYVDIDLNSEPESVFLRVEYSRGQ